MRIERFLSRFSSWAAAAVFCAVALFATPSSAQKLSGINDLFGQGSSAGDKLKPHGPKVEFGLLPGDAKPGDIVTLSVAVKVPKNGYTYSTSPKFSGGTRIEITDAAGLEPVDENWQPNHPPKVVFEPIFNKELEKHFGDVTWSRKFRVRPDAKPQQIAVKGTMRYQVCDERSCTPYHVAMNVPLGQTVPATDAPPAKSAPADTPAMVANPFEFTASPDVRGQGKPASVRVQLAPANAKTGQEVTLSVTLRVEPPWHSYSLTQDPAEGVALPTKIDIPQLNGLQPVDDKWTASRPHEVKEEQIENKKVHQEVYEGEVTWTRRFVAEKSDADGAYGIGGKIRYQLCDAKSCLPPATVKFAVGLVKPASETAAATTSETSEESLAAANAGGPTQTMGLIPFLIAAATAGFLALLTPCVFPMVPITVSFFLKRAESEHHRPVSTALLYCAGIVVTFTLLGLLMAVIFGASSINQFANNVWLNLAIAGVLVFFGINLLGLFEIRVPAWLLTWSSQKEGQGGVAGILFMAFTFTLVSFTCTFAFAGLLLVWAAKGEYYWPILGMVAFSTTFALPFFFLALFPSYLHRLPKSGGWMNRVKVVMGMIELGAAFKFLSVADLSANPVPMLFDYSFVMSAWMAISICTAFYLFGIFRTPHDTPGESVGVFRLGMAMTFMGWAVYLAVGLFGSTEPTGKLWQQIVAFAPPRFEGGQGDFGPFVEHKGLKFAVDYQLAVKYAEEKNTPLFLDFTGVNCVNCRLMEQRMQKPINREQLDKLVLVQLYTDNVPGIQDQQRVDQLLDKNRDLQQNWFGDVTLPSYAVVTPDGQTVLATFKGLEQSDGEFAKFLETGLTKWQQLQSTASTGVARR